MALSLFLVYHIIYYIEDLDGRFVEFQTLPRTSATSTLGEEDQMPIEGFKYWDWKQSGGYQDLWLKYTRKDLILISSIVQI